MRLLRKIVSYEYELRGRCVGLNGFLFLLSGTLAKHDDVLFREGFVDEVRPDLDLRLLQRRQGKVLEQLQDRGVALFFRLVLSPLSSVLIRSATTYQSTFSIFQIKSIIPSPLKTIPDIP